MDTDETPTPPNTPPPPPPGGPGGPVIGNPVDSPPPAGGGSRSILVVAVLVALAVVGAAAALFAFSGDDDAADVTGFTEEPRDDTDATDETEDSTETSKPDEPMSVTTTGPDDEPSGDDECRYVGVDTFDDMQVELVFTNPLDDAGSLDITYALTDGDDVRFVTGSEYIESPQPGERFRIESDTVEELPSSIDESDVGCAILQIEEGFGDPPAPVEDAECEFVEVDFADDIQVELTVTNPFDEVGDLTIRYALRGLDDVRFATGTEFVEVVAPGEVVRVQADSVTEQPGWADESDITCEVVALESA